MKSYSSREVIKMLKADVWYPVHIVGGYDQFKHPTKNGIIAVTHPKNDVPIIGTLKAIEKQSDVRF